MSAEAISRDADITAELAGADFVALDDSEPTDEAAQAQLSAAIRIVKGNPSDEEIAALVAVLTAAASTASPVADARPSELWGTPASMHRTFTPFSPYSYAAANRF